MRIMLHYKGMKTTLFLLAAAAALTGEAKPAFFNPGRICAVPGVPCEVYYAKIFDSCTSQAYLLEARSPVGRALEGRWSFTPAPEDAGKSYPFVFGVDPIGGYYTGPEEGNALHANPTGGRQMGDGLFAWLANDLDTRAAR